MNAAESWLPVAGAEGLYEVSDLGRVRTTSRVVAVAGTRGRPTLGRILRPYERGRYLAVTINQGGRGRSRPVHQIVLESFCGQRPVGMQCRHLDGNCRNNELPNLRWGTPKENAADRVSHGTALFGERANAAKLTRGVVIEVRRRRAAGERYSDMAADYEVSEDAVRAAATGGNWRWLREEGAECAKSAPQRKLSAHDVVTIRELWSRGESQRRIASRFAVTQSTVSLIVNRKRGYSRSQP